MYTAKNREKLGIMSHRKTGDKGIIREIYRGHFVHILVDFDDGRADVCGWANLRKIGEMG